MKRPVLIIGSVVVALLLMGASFYGGTLYQRNSANQTRNRFLASRGIDANTSGGGAGGARQGFGFGGGAQGQVKSINGNTLTISTAQNETSVTVSGATVILKSDPGTLADLKVGDRVLVTGQRDSSGNITASQVMVIAPTGGTGPSGNIGSGN
jgi:hypothetical protein